VALATPLVVAVAAASFDSASALIWANVGEGIVGGRSVGHLTGPCDVAELVLDLALSITVPLALLELSLCSAPIIGAAAAGTVGGGIT